MILSMVSVATATERVEVSESDNLSNSASILSNEEILANYAEKGFQELVKSQQTLAQEIMVVDGEMYMADELGNPYVIENGIKTLIVSPETMTPVTDDAVLNILNESLLDTNSTSGIESRWWADPTTSNTYDLTSGKSYKQSGLKVNHSTPLLRLVSNPVTNFTSNNNLIISLTNTTYSKNSDTYLAYYLYNAANQTWGTVYQVNNFVGAPISLRGTFSAAQVYINNINLQSFDLTIYQQ